MAKKANHTDLSFTKPLNNHIIIPCGSVATSRHSDDDLYHCNCTELQVRTTIW